MFGFPLWDGWPYTIYPWDIPVSHLSMDWFKGQFQPERPIFFMGKSMVPGCSRCRFSRQNQWYVLSTIYPWYTHDIFHDIPVIYPWYTHDIFHDIPVIYPWYTHDIPMIYPWYIPSLFSSHPCEITGDIGIWSGGGGHHRCQLGTWAVKHTIRPRYKVGPQTIAKFVQITPITMVTMVYGPYNYSYILCYTIVTGAYKPTYNWGGPTL